MRLEKNLGGLDRIIRMLLGLGLLYIAIFKAEWMGDPVLVVLASVFGIVNIISAVICWCPPYALIGHSTYKKR